ncbi:MAG: endolytic transglycosylase MltG [Candidatus Paceibacterota bacterium]
MNLMKGKKELIKNTSRKNKNKLRVHRVANHFFRTVSIVSIFTVIVVSAIFIYYKTLPKSYVVSTLDVATSVDATPSQIADQLEAEGYIKHPLIFRIALFVRSLEGKIQSGAYKLSENMNDWEVLQALANPYMRWVKIPEGLRKEQVADIFGKALAWNDTQKDDFIKLEANGDSLEGYYFPENYLVSVNQTPDHVADRMADKFKKQVSEKFEDTAKNKIINMDTALIVASLIQREAAGKDDMRLISGIIWNRIFNGMTLDIDATLQYIKGNEQNWWPKVDPKDKEIDSPYNTYKYKGLPPTPISNPGVAAIDAALNPKSTQCIFYIHDKKRKIHCSVTYKEHLKMIKKYL